MSDSERRPNRPPMYCVVCGYDLSHAPHNLCSECGSPFDPTNERTYCDSPKLIHRVMKRAPVLRKWILEHHCGLHCRNCGVRIEPDGEPGRCAKCNVHCDPRDSYTVTRALHIIPPGLIRFQHIAPIRGVILPLLLLITGVAGLVTQKTYFPAFNRVTFFAGMHLATGLAGVLLSVAWIGGATVLHSSYFWGRVEPHWKWSPIGVWIGTTLIVISAIGLLGYLAYQMATL